MIKVILDNGHGKETNGKRSPIWADGTQLFEYEFNRDIVKRIAKKLQALNIPYHILVSEIVDISLGERVRRANRLHKESNCFLVSVHGNAGGGKGWEVWTSKGKTKSDAIAEIFAKEAQKHFKVRVDMTDGDMDKESDFYILKHTTCPAILTENLFFDTESDCKIMMSEEGRELIADIHVNAIKKICESMAI